MTIQTVIDNLDRTIKGKTKLRGILDRGDGTQSAEAEFLRVNIEELGRIRDDLIKVRDGS